MAWVSVSVPKKCMRHFLNCKFFWKIHSLITLSSWEWDGYFTYHSLAGETESYRTPGIPRGWYHSLIRMSISVHTMGSTLDARLAFWVTSVLRQVNWTELRKFNQASFRVALHPVVLWVIIGSVFSEFVRRFLDFMFAVYSSGSRKKYWIMGSEFMVWCSNAISRCLSKHRC